MTQITKMLKGREGQSSVDFLVPVAVALVIVAVFAGVGSIVLTELEDATDYIDDATITNEVHQPANNTNSGIGGGGVTVTVDTPGDRIRGETWTFGDKSAGTNVTLTAGDNYTVLNRLNGRFNFTDVNGYDTTSAQNDKLYVDYTNQTESPADPILRTGTDAMNTLADFLVVIIVVSIAVVIFSLLSVMRRTSRQSSV